MQDKLRKDENISVAVSQLPVCQIELVLPFIPHHHPLGTQRPCADHADDLHGNIGLWIKSGQRGSSGIDIWYGRLNSREAHRAIVTVVPEPDGASDTGRNEYIQKQVKEESAA